MSAAIATIPTADGVVTASHNMTPFDEVSSEVEGVFLEATYWLDGKPVETQADANVIGQILDLARKAEKAVDEARKVEKKPHDDAAKAVQAKYKPLLDRVSLIASGCKAALRPFEERREAERRAAAEAARREAEQKAAEAQVAIRSAALADLQARENAERLLTEAKRADATAKRAENATSATKVGNRSVSLRTTYRAEVTDHVAYARFVWSERHGELIEFLDGLAQRQVNAGRHELPGVTIHTERSAV